MTRSNIQWNAKQITKMVKNGNLQFDNAVQRGFVWDKKRMSLLIDSMLRDYPIPPMYTIKVDETVNEKGKKSAVYDCLDGKQRCTTISRYLSDEFVLGDLDRVIDENGDEVDISGYLFSELPEEFQDKIASYSLTVYFFTEIEEEEINEMMARLNNGKPLTAYELSRVKAKDLETIKSLANHSLFDEISNKGYACEDIVVKSYAMLTEAEPCLDTKAIRPMVEEMELDDEDITMLESCFDLIESVRDYIINDDSDIILNRKVAKKLITKTHLISLMPLAYEVCNDDSVSVEQFAQFLQDFFVGDPSKRDDYNDACKNGVGHIPNVRIRIDALEEEYNGFMESIKAA